MATLIVQADGTHINEDTGRPIPPRPSPFHVYDWGADSWLDRRDEAERARDRAAALSAARAAAYPPLADLADALYWQSRGDASKLSAYLAACATVKSTYSKP